MQGLGDSTGGESVRPEGGLTPEEEELERKRSEMRELSEEAIEREMQRATLRSQIDGFARSRLFHLGPLHAELDDLDARIEEALSSQHPADPVPRRRAQEARARARASAEAAAAALEKGPGRVETPTREAQDAYGDAARKMHADLGRADGSDRRRRTEFMARLNDAHGRGDVEAVHHLVDLWEACQDPVPESSAGEELVRVIRAIARLKKSIRQVDAEIGALRAKPDYGMLFEAGRAAAGGRNLIDPTPIRARIEQKRRRLRELTGEDV